MESFPAIERMFDCGASIPEHAFYVKGQFSDFGPKASPTSEDLPVGHAIAGWATDGSGGLGTALLPLAAIAHPAVMALD